MIQTDIYGKVVDHKDYLIDKYNYPKDSLIGAFPFGSMNYGLFEDEISDVDTKIIYVPTYQELVFNKPISKKYTFKDTEEQIEIKDIRLMVDMWKKQNINFVEILFTPYDWINPKYSYLWAETFYCYRHAIAEYNPEYFANSVCGQAKGYIKDLKKEYNPKKVANLLRLKNTLYSFLNRQLPYNEAIDCQTLWHKNFGISRDYYLNYKHDQVRISNEDLNELYTWFETFPTEGIKRKINEDRRKVMDMLFQNWILAFLKEREITL